MSCLGLIGCAGSIQIAMQSMAEYATTKGSSVASGNLPHRLLHGLTDIMLGGAGALHRVGHPWRIPEGMSKLWQVRGYFGGAPKKN